MFSLAYPINDDDWGTERQVDAENDVYHVLERLGVDIGEESEFARWALKATTEERLDECRKLWQEFNATT
jgi:hypothetical protein